MQAPAFQEGEMEPSWNHLAFKGSGDTNPSTRWVGPYQGEPEQRSTDRKRTIDTGPRPKAITSDKNLPDYVSLGE